MINTLIKINAFLKGFIYFLSPHLIFGFLRTPFLFASNILAVSSWIRKQDRKNILDDFYSPVRRYTKRIELYQYIVDKYKLKEEHINYLEFGVCNGSSFLWWVNSNNNPSSKFAGFDTFEGLPEDWGIIFSKGDLKGSMPKIDDARCELVKGLFQDSLIPYLKSNNLNIGNKKIIHLDADLFTSTLFTLTTLSQYLNPGDIIIFDEFNTPNHEFFAWDIYTKSFYIKYKLIGAVNNYFQVAFEIQA